jgi:hypothetical protein
MSRQEFNKVIKYVLFIFVLLIGLAAIIFLVWGGYKLTLYGYHLFSTLDRNIAAAIIAASATVIASTGAIIIGRHYEAEKERLAAHREKKVVLYDSFLDKMFGVFVKSQEHRTQEDMVDYLRETNRKVILWSGPNVVKAYALWQRELSSAPTPKAKSLIRMIDFFLALRKDLGHSNKGIKREYLLRFLIKNPDLFMKLYRRNREVTLTEIGNAEKDEVTIK